MEREKGNKGSLITMGHVTIVHEDINEARKIAENVKNTIKVISK